MATIITQYCKKGMLQIKIIKYDSVILTELFREI